MKPIVICSLLLCLFGGCLSLSTPDLVKIENDLKSMKIDSIMHAATGGAAAGLRDSLTDPSSRARLDSLVSSLGRSIVLGVQDTLLNKGMRAKIDSTLSEIVSTLTGKNTRLTLDSLINGVGKTTRAQVTLLLDELLGKRTLAKIDVLLDHVSGDSLKFKVDSLEEHLLGAKSQRDIRAILDAINSNATKAETGVKDTGSWLIWTLVGAIVVVLGFATWMFIVRRRYQKMSEVMTHAIHYIPDRSSYDELTKRISSEAKKQKVEPHLRKLLAAQGLLDSDTWKNTVIQH